MIIAKIFGFKEFFNLDYLEFYPDFLEPFSQVTIKDKVQFLKFNLPRLL